MRYSSCRPAAAMVAVAAFALALLQPAGALAVPPTVTTATPSAVGPDSYIAHGSVNPNGTDTNYGFDWNENGNGGPSYAYGTQPPTDAGAGTTPLKVSRQLRAVADWPYHYNLFASNSNGEEAAAGADRAFTTPPDASAPGAPGDLDVHRPSTGSPGFGEHGRAGPTNDGVDATDPPTGYPDDAGNALVVQHNGEIVVAGTAGATGILQAPGGFAVRRFTADGQPDTSFNGGQGVVRTPFSGESNISGNAVALQELSGATADDRIVVVGTGASGAGQDVLVAGYTSAGELDGDFGQNSSGEFILAGAGAANAVVIAPDNTLWVAGGDATTTKLWHISADGQRLLGTHSVNSVGAATALVRQSDGRLVATAGKSSTLKLIRWLASGARDVSFGSNGIATATAAGPALAVALDERGCTAAQPCPTRRLFAAGGDAQSFTLAAVDDTGAPISGFGSSGIVRTAGTGSPARAVLVQGDGKVIAAGVDVSDPDTGPNMLLIRYGSSGAIDSSFGLGGRVITGYPYPASMNTPSGYGADAEANALAVLPDGRILAAGSDGDIPNIIQAPPPQRRTSVSTMVNPNVVPDMALVRYQGGPPDTSITLAPSTVTGSQSATFSFSSTVTGASFECRLDQGAWAACTSPHQVGPLPFGQHTFSVRAIDAFRHPDPTPASYQWRICSGCDSLPDTQITSTPPALSNATTATFTFVADDPTDTFECQLDGGAFSACSSPDQLSGLGDGTHTFAVRAVNGKGVDPAPATFTWVLDTVPPRTRITGGPSGSISNPSAAFTFASDTPASTFQCNLDGAGWAGCFSPATFLVGTGKHVFSVRAIDPAGNIDPAPPTRTFTFEQTSCSSTVGFDYVSARGCFGKKSGRDVATPGSDVNLNGLTLHPTSSSTTITIDPVDHKVSASGPVLVSAGDIPVDQEQLDWKVPGPNGNGRAQLTTLHPPAGAAIAGLPLQGDLSLTITSAKGTDLAGNVLLPFGHVADALGINGTATLHTTLDAGLLHDQIVVQRDYLEIDGVGIQQLKVVYSPTDDLWEGAASVALPTPNKLDIAAALSFQHGNFHKFSGSVDHLNFPIISGIYLQRIAIVFGVDPTTIGGGLGVSFGPNVSGQTLVQVDGNFLYQGASGSTPGKIHIDGDVKVGGFKLVNGYFDYLTSGLIQFGAHASVGLPDSSDPKPQNEPVFIDADLAGVVQSPHFDIDVKATAELNFIDTSVGVELLVSDKALAACAHLSAFGFGWDPGAAYTWSDGNLDLMFDSCSVGPYRTLAAASVAAAGQRSLVLAGGSELIALTGATANPKVTLAGPRGQTVTVPASSVAPMMVPGFMVFQDPKDKVTYIAIQHAGGRWRIVPQAGSSPVTVIRRAQLLPPPRIRAHVSGSGRRRRLTWRLLRIPGQRIVFWERGRDSAKLIGSTTSARGSLRFTLADASAGRRTIEAQVFSFGKPRKDLVVARFRAPGPLRPPHVTRLRTHKARGGAVRVSWRRSAGAQRYVVEVDTRDGAHLVKFASARSRSVTVTNVIPIVKARVTVIPESARGLKGRAARAKFPSPPPRRHHKHKRKHKRG